MLERVRLIRGETLDPAAYSAAFDAAYEKIVFWKLERRQTFREPGDPSWEAFAAGDWTRSLKLNDAEWESVLAKVDEDADLGVESRRLRIVEKPVTPYLHWEMQYFRLLAKAGEDLRVLPAEAVRAWEGTGPLPEVVVLGHQVLFEVLYDADGTVIGARRIDEPEVIQACIAELAALYAGAEPLLDYFDREIAPLPPPM
jgi:uncharacterized protein DUF6879